jgi:hypothetical protein
MMIKAVRLLSAKCFFQRDKWLRKTPTGLTAGDDQTCFGP